MILGLELAAQMDIRKLLVKGNSLLIIQQVLGKFDVKEQQLVVCKAKVKSLLSKFEEVLFEHIARSSNRMTDALAVLGARLLQLGGTGRPIIWFARQDAPSGALLPSAYPVHSFAVDGYKEWYNDVFEYLANGYLPSNHHKARDTRRRAAPFYLDGELLYKRAMDGVLLRCLNKEESLDAMKEAHEGSCGKHQGGR